MKKLIAFYSRADENYFGGAYRVIPVGNTEKAAHMLAELTGADLFKIEQKVPYSANYQQCIAEAKRDLQAKQHRKDHQRDQLADDIALSGRRLLGHQTHRAQLVRHDGRIVVHEHFLTVRAHELQRGREQHTGRNAFDCKDHTKTSSQRSRHATPCDLS